MIVRSHNDGIIGSRAKGSFLIVNTGQSLCKLAKSNHFSNPGSESDTIALTGHSGTQTAQSIHSSGSMINIFGPSLKQSTGHTVTQSVYLQS